LNIVSFPLASRRLTSFESGVGASATPSSTFSNCLTSPTKWLAQWLVGAGIGSGLCPGLGSIAGGIIGGTVVYWNDDNSNVSTYSTNPWGSAIGTG